MEITISMFEAFLFITAILFTFFGYYMARDKVKNQIGTIVEHTIDGLIEQGYVKIRKNKDGEI